MIERQTLALFLIMMLVPIYVQAKVYRCTTDDGHLIFQQVPCGDNQKEETVQIQSGPSSEEVAAAQARLRAIEERNRRAERVRYHTEPAHDRQPNESRNAPLSVASERDEAHTYGGACPPGQVPLNPSRLDPARGWSGSRGYVPLRCGDPDEPASDRAVRTGPGITEPRRIQDQTGNWYTQPPGSSFARDERTGRQCFVFGDFVRCD
jgi:hypothetical protein